MELLVAAAPQLRNKFYLLKQRCALLSQQIKITHQVKLTPHVLHIINTKAPAAGPKSPIIQANRPKFRVNNTYLGVFYL